MNEPKKKMNQCVRTEIFLMLAMMLLPVLTQVIVEQVKGPGYGATAAELMIYIIIGNSILASLNMFNLQKALNSVPQEHDA